MNKLAPATNTPSTLSRLWPPLVAILLCLPAALPYLSGDIPRSNDTLTHLYRAVELEHLIRSGILLPRWAPDFALGYGYPIFNYFAYLTHYLVALLGLIGLPLLTAVKTVYVLGIAASGITSFLLARDLISPLPLGAVSSGTRTGSGGEGSRDAPAYLAAVAYTYSPYLLFTAHVRGGLPEIVALAFVPLAFWAVRRALVLSTQKLRYSLIAAVAIAGFILSHIGMALQYLPLLGLWGLYCIARQWWLNRLASIERSEPASKTISPASQLFTPLLTLSAIFTLALGLTAFIWLPSVVELPAVQFDAAFARAGLVYTANFLQLPNLFEFPSLPVYTAVLNPPLVRSIPIVAALIALLGLIRIRAFSPTARADYIFLLAFSALCCFLTLDLSKPLWDAIPLLQRSAFPWRFLGPAALFIALAAALSAQQLVLALNNALSFLVSRLPALASQLPFLICSLFIVPLLIASTPFLFPPREPALQDPTLADLARYEIPPLLVGTTTTGEYTPIAVKEFPDTHDMQAALIEGRQPNRLIIDNAPEGTQFEHLIQEPLHEVYQFTTSATLTATYRTFYFPGWQATLDGAPYNIQITDPNGLMAFTIPSGTHTLELKFGTTPIRTVATIVSILALITLAAGIAYTVINREPVATISSAPNTHWGFAAFRRAVPGIWILGFSYFSLFITSSLIIRSGPPATQHPLNLDFGGELTLIGYNTAPSPFTTYQLPFTNPQSPVTNTSTITLIWSAQHPIGVPYGMNIRMVDAAGLIWNDNNIQRPANWRFSPGTDGWPVDQFVLDPYIINPLRGTPPGTYQLEVIVYRADTLQALSVQPIGEYVVEDGTNEPLADPLLTLDNVALIDFETDRAEAAPGDPYRLTFYWQALADSPPEQDVTLELVDGQGAVAFTRTEPLVPQYTPPHWQAGDVLRQDVIFRLPASLPGGGYHWRVAGAALTAPAASGLTVNEPPRLFELPPLTNLQTHSLTSAIQLLGYNATLNGNAITIELAWQGTEEISEPYQVFLHLIDSNGALVSQSDGEPANWTRPTTGWLPGEIILDPRTLTAPGPGIYTLMVGMVDPSGNRIAEPISLGPLEVP